MGTTNALRGIDGEDNDKVWPHRYRVSTNDEVSPNISDEHY